MSAPARSPRFPAPDIARGFMLALIAVANVNVWVSPRSIDMSQLSGADRAWIVIRSCLVDLRAIPLFACLFGFGMAVMLQRFYESGDTDAGRQLIRRRGWWFIVIGAMHGVLFPFDVIGTYGVIAVALAGLFAARRDKTLIVLAIVFFVVEFVAPHVPFGELGAAADQYDHGITDATLLVRLALWTSTTLFAPVGTNTVTAVVVGYFVARTTLLETPAQHVRALTRVAIGGLTVAVLFGLPVGLQLAGFTVEAGRGFDSVAIPLFKLGGLSGAAGWLAVFALVAARVQVAHGERLSNEQVAALPVGLRALIATGQRSMTAYLGQSVLYAVVFVSASQLGWIDELSPAVAAIVAVGAYIVLMVMCFALGERHQPGPAERVLRNLTYR